MVPRSMAGHCRCVQLGKSPSQTPLHALQAVGTRATLKAKNASHG